MKDKKLSKDIFINIENEEVIKRIDILAKENSMTRNDFLITSLEKLVESDEVLNINSLFKELINNNLEILKLNTKVMNEICDINCIDLNRLKFF